MLTHLRCWRCRRTYPWRRLINLCDCGMPLRAEFELDPQTLPKEALRDREPTLWRYKEVLPPVPPVSLGEGMTPLLPAPRLGRRWYVKDEAQNPTGSFKSRGMTTAVAVALHLGADVLAAPSQGNAAGALAAYAARAGLPTHVFMPTDTPQPCIQECEQYGADVTLVDGLIGDCAAEMRRRMNEKPGPGAWFDLSTLKEPYRVEGKKTMGYELAEQMDWHLPDVIIYPTGGGTGLIGMWKAFKEMKSLGWIGDERPKMVAVQAQNCAPIVRAFEAGAEFAEEFPNPETIAAGLRVPSAIGDFIMLQVLRESKGTAVAVSDDELLACSIEMTRTTGVHACPEGGATLAAARRLRECDFIKDSDTVVLFNTASGLKYLDVLSETGARQHA
ncbi:MAG: threonine synthase [Armatimonadetes bacterium]|nr:threonine synthase [Armatimonadota bacterium]